MKRYAEYKDSGIEWIGEIPSGWSVVPIKRILSAIQDGTHATFARVADGMPLLSAKNVSDDGVEISESESLISKSDFNTIVSNGFPMCGDVLLCCVGTIGRCCIYSFDTQMAFQRSVSFLRVNDKMTNRFLLYSLKSSTLVRQMMAFANSSAQSGIYMGIVKSLMLSLPPVLIQQQIVTHLDNKTAAIDELITDKQKLVALLQEKRNVVISETVTKGLDKTAKMKDSSIAEFALIPDHWCITSFNKVFSIKAGGDVKSDLFSEVQTNDYPYPIFTNAIDENAIYGYSKEAFFQKDSITITGRGDVGHAIYRSTPFDAIIRLLVLTAKSEACCKYFVYLINSSIHFTVGSSAINQLSTQQLAPYKVCVPPFEEQNQIVNYLDCETAQIDTLISDINEQIEKLKEYRQAVISEAVTGKVAV